MSDTLENFDPFAPKAKSLDDFDPFAQPAPPTQATPATPAIARPSGIVRRVVGDTAVDVGKGILGVGEAAVGLGNLVSGGYVGKGLEAIGYDPQTSKKMLEEGYTHERVAANKAVEDASGFVGTAKAMIANPSTIAGAAVESAPLMLGGGAIARGGASLLGRAGSIAAPGIRGAAAAIPHTTAGRIGLAAAGEGAVGAGVAAEQIRQQTDDGLLSAKQTGAALASGAGTAALGALGGKVAQKLGIADVDVALAGGSTARAATAEVKPGLTEAAKRMLKRVAGGALTEGVFEELPQSAQEQMWQNYATGKPLMGGVPEASAMGMLAGGVMGGGFSAIARPGAEPKAKDTTENPSGVARPNSGPLALPAPDGTKSYGTIEVDPDGTARKTMPDGVLAVNDPPVAQPTVPGNRADPSSQNQRAGESFDPTPSEQAAANMRMQAQVMDAQAQTGIGRAAAMATAMQADAIEQEAPLDRLARVSAAAGIDPAEAVKAHQAYDPEDKDGASFADLPDDVLTTYAKTLLEDARGPLQERPGVDSVGVRGDAVPVPGGELDPAGSVAGQVDGGAAIAGEQAAAGADDAAGAQAQRVIDSRPWQAFRGGRRVESYSTENIRADAKNSIDNGYGVYVTSDTATADHYGSQSEGGSRHALEISAPRHSLLDRDKPLSEQSPQIIAGLKAAGLYEGNESTLGKGLYDRLVSENKKGGLSLARDSNVDAMKAANARLQAAGIRGLSYQARHIPGVTNTAEHYVIFDGADIRNTDQTNAGAQAQGLDALPESSSQQTARNPDAAESGVVATLAREPNLPAPPSAASSAAQTNEASPQEQLRASPSATPQAASSPSQTSGTQAAQAPESAESSQAASGTYSPDLDPQSTQSQTATTEGRAGQTAQTAAPLSQQSNSSSPSPQSAPATAEVQVDPAVREAIDTDPVLASNKERAARAATMPEAEFVAAEIAQAQESLAKANADAATAQGARATFDAELAQHVAATKRYRLTGGGLRKNTPQPLVDAETKLRERATFIRRSEEMAAQARTEAGKITEASAKAMYGRLRERLQPAAPDAQSGQDRAQSGQARETDTGIALESVEEMDPADLTPAQRASLNRQRAYGFNGSDGVGMTDAERSAFDVLAREESRAGGIEDSDKLGLRPAVNAAIGGKFGLPTIQAVYLRGPAGLDGIVRPGYLQSLQDQQKRRKNGSRTAGLYLQSKDTVDGVPRFVLFTDVVRTPANAAFTASHEVAGHHGIRALFGRKLDAELNRAGRNKTVAAIADSMMAKRNLPASKRSLAIEEALADLAAAVRTGNYAEIQKRHGVEVPLEMRSGLRATIARIVNAIRSLLRTKNIRMTDAQVHSLLENAWKAAQSTESAISTQESALESAEPVASNEGSILESVEGDMESTLGNAMGSIRDVKLPAGYMLADLFGKHEGKALNWWHKSVGTQYNLAQREPLFKRVFDSVQNMVADISHYANAAMDLAPDVLPKFDSIRDALKKQPMAAKDAKVVSSAVFDGTLKWARDRNTGEVIPATELNSGIVWTAEELRSRFGATGSMQSNGKYDGQIGLYFQVRAAIDRSLDDTAVSQMIRHAGEDGNPVREQMLAAPTAQAAAEILSKHLTGQVKLMQGDSRSKALLETAEQVEQIAKQIDKLKSKGYAPLSRFGRYTVYKDGDKPVFLMFETQREANRAARMMKEKGDKGIKQGTMSQEQFKLFKGMTPETLELFGEMLGLDNTGNKDDDLVFQSFLKAAKSNRSALKRLIHRQGIEGYSEDVSRVLAAFLYSNARLAATNLHAPETQKAINDIPKEQGDLKDTAIKLNEYIVNPDDAGAFLSSFNFAQYLGGSIASALVNMTQPLTMSFPWLSQYGGAWNAAKALGDAVKIVGKGGNTGNALLDEALKRADADGHTQPQEVHQLQALASGKGALRTGDGTKAGDALAKAQNAKARLSVLWGVPFSLAEQFNRRSTFIAAWNIATEQRMADPYGFAVEAVKTTQGIYNKANRPAWSRNAIGGMAFTFKTYSINYVEMLHRMWTKGGKEGKEGKQGVMLAMGVLFLLSGAGGLPGGDDLDDLIDGVMQRMGYNFSSKQEREEFFASLFGETGAKFMEHGLSAVPGMPIDVSGRMGMGNLLPATGLFVRKDDHTRDVAEIAGPTGDFIKRSFDSAGQLAEGNLGASMLAIAPRAAANWWKGIEMGSTGEYRDTKGRKVIDTTPGEAAAKFIGFQPATVAKVQQASGKAYDLLGNYRVVAADIADRWAKGVHEGDQDAVAEAQQDLADWNEKNPDMPIRITRNAIQRRVFNLRLDRRQRLAKTTPKAVRSQIENMLDDGQSRRERRLQERMEPTEDAE